MALEKGTVKRKEGLRKGRVPRVRMLPIPTTQEAPPGWNFRLGNLNIQLMPPSSEPLVPTIRIGGGGGGRSSSGQAAGEESKRKKKSGKPPAGSRPKLRAKAGAGIGRGKRFVGEITPSPMSFFAGRPPGLASPDIPPDLEEAVLDMQNRRRQLGLPPELLAPRIPGSAPPPVHTRRPTTKSPAEEERARRGIFRADIGDRLDELYRASKPEPGGEMEGPDEVADIDRPDVASSQEEYNRKWREQQAFVDRWLRNSATYELGKEAQRQLEGFMARHPEFERNRFNQAREEAGFQPLTMQQAIPRGILRAEALQPLSREVYLGAAEDEVAGWVDDIFNVLGSGGDPRTYRLPGEEGDVTLEQGLTEAVEHYLNHGVTQEELRRIISDVASKHGVSLEQLPRLLPPATSASIMGSLTPGPPPTTTGVPSIGAPPPLPYLPGFERQRSAVPPPTSLLPQSGQFLPNIMPELDQNTINAMGMSGVAGLLALLLRQAPQLAGQFASSLFPVPPPGQPFIRG